MGLFPLYEALSENEDVDKYKSPKHKTGHTKEPFNETSEPTVMHGVALSSKLLHTG